MAYCPRCGTLLNPGDKFCPRCGTSAGGDAQEPPRTHVPPVHDGALDTISVLTLLWGILAIVIGTASVVLLLPGSSEEDAFIITVVLMPLVLSGAFSLVTSHCARNRKNYGLCVWCCALSSVCAVGSVVCFIVGIAICIWLSGKRIYFTS